MLIKRQRVVRNLMAKLAALPMIAVGLFVFVGGSLWSVFYSFTSSRSLPKERFVGLEQYQRLFESSRWQVSIDNMLIFGVCSLVFSLLVGFLLAVALDQKIRFENTFRTIFLYPFALSFVVTGLVWQWLLNADFGIAQVVRNMGFEQFELSILYTRFMPLSLLVFGKAQALLWPCC